MAVYGVAIPHSYLGWAVLPIACARKVSMDMVLDVIRGLMCSPEMLEPKSCKRYGYNPVVFAIFFTWLKHTECSGVVMLLSSFGSLSSE